MTGTGIEQDSLHDTGIRVMGHPMMVMTEHAADRWADELSALACSTGIPVTPEDVRRRERKAGGPLPGKFIQSVYLADEGGAPIALIGGHEEGSDLFGFPAYFVVVLAVDSRRQGEGLSRAFAEAAIERTVGLGWTELETDAPFRLACVISPLRDEVLLSAYYERLGFRSLGLIDTPEDGRVLAMSATVGDLARIHRL